MSSASASTSATDAGLQSHHRALGWFQPARLAAWWTHTARCVIRRAEGYTASSTRHRGAAGMPMTSAAAARPRRVQIYRTRYFGLGRPRRQPPFMPPPPAPRDGDDGDDGDERDVAAVERRRKSKRGGVGRQVHCYPSRPRRLCPH